ncbi:30S ribosomal protein S9 [Ichthyobacterium seriolicida]|uniref:30S ribosomal protein S9 n=1 Tax=Ichthyobacterium seriolicida TaxID=242600 RepID=UPI000BBC19F3|nr:30S ribosomal protein S9 [Ichthyobacterium seriolicida]
METIHKIGRRKTSVARVFLSEGKGDITINKRELSSYFPTAILNHKVQQPLIITDNQGKYNVNVTVVGGGFTGQAEAIRLAISRALVELDDQNKPSLKAKGLMTRDSRMVERKKPGQKKARKRFQFSKR